MYSVNIRHNGKLRVRRSMRALPAIGHVLRFASQDYGRVTDVCWCMDEPSAEGYRVNITTIRLNKEGRDFAVIALLRRCGNALGRALSL